MKERMFCAAVAAVIGFIGCTNQQKQNLNTVTSDTTSAKTVGRINNLVSIVEIPASDFSRAITFYQDILGITIEAIEMDGVKMGLFPASDNHVFVQLVNGSDYKPSAEGTTVYLNAGNDLQQVVDKISANGGQIIVAKTQIAPEMGYFAIFIDTEGNKVGLHSPH